MRVQRRDRIASAAVLVAVLAYVVWWLVVDEPDDAAVRWMVATVLGLGVVASAVAVVPAFDALVHGPKSYLVPASLLGVLALAAAVVSLVTADGTMLAVLVATTVVLWVTASARHAAIARRAGPAGR